MKILYYPIRQPISKDPCQGDLDGVQAEYLTDSLFHGLKSLLGEDIIDVERLWHMYADAPKERLRKLYGRGFTLYGLLAEGQVDRTDIEQKLRNCYFQYVILPVHCTVADRSPHHNGIIAKTINHISQFYGPDRIIFIDTLDQQEVYNFVKGKCLYFKRELTDGQNGLIPIEYSIPKEKIVGPTDKIQEMADYLPGHPYKYDNETDYYEGYRKAWYGHTWKKGGWTALRHYEILACGCIPLFKDLHKCPQNTLYFFPKDLLRSTLPKADLVSLLVEYTKEMLTTEAMAKYLLSRIT